MVKFSLSKKGIDAIIGYEIGCDYPGDLRAYKSKYGYPTVPSDTSGVTIGIGYDLGMNSANKIKADWVGKVNANALAFFISCAGITGNAARRKITPATKFFVTYDAAYDVFTNSTLPRFCKLVLEIYPNVVKLNPMAQAVLVSLVYNRGNGILDISTNAKKEQRRKEMRALIALVDKQDYKGMAKEFVNMKRLWDGIPDYEGDVEQRLKGLLDRRDNESKMILESINMTFTNGEVMEILV